jgi:hypothetical protein
MESESDYTVIPSIMSIRSTGHTLGSGCIDYTYKALPRSHIQAGYIAEEFLAELLTWGSLGVGCRGINDGSTSSSGYSFRL